VPVERRDVKHSLPAEVSAGQILSLIHI